MGWTPCLVRSWTEDELSEITLGQPLLDDYLAFAGARARRNTWLAIAYDLATVRSFMMVERSTPALSAAPAIVASWRTSWIQISYFCCGVRNRLRRRPARSVPTLLLRHVHILLAGPAAPRSVD